MTKNIKNKILANGLYKMEQYYILLAILLVSLVFVSLVPIIEIGYAHRDGCHRWHSCPSDSGSYVCGDLGRDDEC